MAEFLRADDAELLPYDCEATLVHARRLHDAGLLSESDLREVEARLAAIREEGPGFVAGDEDIHSTLERLLGPVGRKVHAGRSRNDQVAAAFRLYVADACVEARDGIANLADVILGLAEREADTLFPGYTHLQRAQPVTLGHHLLAWTEMLERDLVRFAHAAEQAGPSPLGAGALAGSTLPLAAPPGPQAANSLDAVADRDFALDYLYACAVLLGHLSRIGEEIVLWCTAEFGLVTLPEAAATGSSMMPQKLNPDVAELVRGQGRHRRSGDSPGSSPSSRASRLRTTATSRRTSRPSSPRDATSAAPWPPSRSSSTGWKSTTSGPPRPPLTRPCWRPTPPRSWSVTACLSATPTSRSPRP